ncbi:MAG TPA: metallophosphoesterase [Candidatus Baltobacteraceae bacterium]
MRLIFLLAAGLVLLIAPGRATAQDTVLAAWTQAGPNGTYLARIIRRGACPQVRIDNREVISHERAGPSRNFDVRTCEAAVPANARSVSVAGHQLPPPPAKIRTIAVLGDTGCRIEIVFFQACKDPVKWPFPTIALQIAASHPDLVIHVGDYYYRETPCLVPECAGSPHGDGWKAWDADFFTPAAPMFAAAPILALRGNHEDCERGGKGWDRFLSIYAYADCSEREAGWSTSIDGIRFFVLDSSSALDPRPRSILVPEYKQDFAKLRSLPHEDTWLLSHRPMWGVEGAIAGGALLLNKTLDAAEGDPRTLPIDLSISGHVHLFETLTFADHRPPQVIVGTGGDTLSPDPGNIQGLKIDNTRIAQATIRHGFGFALFDVGRKSFEVYDSIGKKVYACKYSPGEVSCNSVSS